MNYKKIKQNCWQSENYVVGENYTHKKNTQLSVKYSKQDHSRNFLGNPQRAQKTYLTIPGACFNGPKIIDQMGFKLTILKIKIFSKQLFSPLRKYANKNHWIKFEIQFNIPIPILYLLKDLFRGFKVEEKLNLGTAMKHDRSH